MFKQLTKSGKPVTIGTGTGTKWQWAKKEASIDKFKPIVDQLKLSIKLGYNHIDTAEMYTTCPEVGQAVHECMAELGIKREDLWITTKYAPFIVRGRRAPDTLTIGFNQMLKDLDVDYVDCLLIHSPYVEPSFNYTLKSLWQELVHLKEQGKIRYIGGSNFSKEHLIEVSEIPGGKPSINQIEFHPNLINPTEGILDYCRANNILIEGYNPLCSLFKFKDEKLANYIESLEKKYNKTNSQIILKWVLEMGVVPITTSSNEERIKQSLDLNFSLSRDEITHISEIGNANPQQLFLIDNDSLLNWNKSK